MKVNEAALRRKIINLVGALVVAVGDVGRPEGECYALVMKACDINLFNDIVGLAAVSGILTQRGRILRLTPKGGALLSELRATVAA